jgi:hypothetical protein
LPSSILIVDPGKIPDMIVIMKCGFSGRVSTEKLKRESQPDDTEPHGEVVWSRATHYRQLIAINQLMARRPAYFPLTPEAPKKNLGALASGAFRA